MGRANHLAAGVQVQGEGSMPPICVSEACVTILSEHCGGHGICSSLKLVGPCSLEKLKN